MMKRQCVIFVWLIGLGLIACNERTEIPATAVATTLATATTATESMTAVPTPALPTATVEPAIPAPTDTPEPPTLTRIGEFTANNRLDGPDGLAVDASGNLYVLDARHNRVLKLDSDGELLTQIGEPGEEDGRLNSLGWGGLTLDPTGEFLYVVDNGSFRVQKFDTAGNFILAFGQQGSDEGQFKRPIYVTTDQEGNVYVTDDENPWLQKFDSQGNFLTRWGGEGSGDGQFTHVTGITIDPAGNIFVADFEGNRIQKFDSEGNFILGWGGAAGSEPGQLRGPNALAAAAAGRIYEVDRMNHRVQVFDNEGNFLLTWGSFGRGDEDFQFPSGIAVGPNGRVYVGDEGNDRIQVYELDWHDGSAQTAVIETTPSVNGSAVTFTTVDGLTLPGTMYGQGTTAVIFSTMGEHHQDTWAEMAQTVAAQGYLAFTYDFRFWQPDGRINDAWRDHAADDLQAAIAYVRDQGVQQIVLVGASLGGMATLDVADEVAPTAVIVLAAPLNETFFPTLHTTPEDIQATHAPILFIGSEGEDFAPDLQQMYDLANDPKEIELYPGNAHGTELFATLHREALRDRILNFIRTYAPTAVTVIPTATPTDRTTATLLPPERVELVPGVWHDMIYHEQLQQVVLVNGGLEQGKAADDPLELWTWDDAQWTLLNSNGPRWRNFASIAYDSQRHVLVLYGGLQSLSEQFAETWEWDRAQWTQSHVPGPGPREAAGMTYDAARSQVILFGGAQDGNIMGDTWSWDGQQWTQLTTSGPSPRFPGGFVYDTVREVVLLAGGHFINFQADDFLTFGDTWLWDGTNWQEIAAAGPSPRDGARAIYDAQRQQILLFGGIQVKGAAATPLADTWIWDGSTWAEIAAAGPDGRGHLAMAYDAARNKVVLFGGAGEIGQLRTDTWEWDGEQWRCVDACPP